MLQRSHTAGKSTGRRLYVPDLLAGRTGRQGRPYNSLPISDPPDLAISVLGVYYHYKLGGGTQARDLMSRELLAVEGVNLIFIDEPDLMEDARYYTEQALQYRDHSAVSTGGTP